MKIIDTIEHKKLIQEQIKTQKQWDNVRQYLTPTLDNQSIQQIITATTSPLFRSIHYNKIISNTYVPAHIHSGIRHSPQDPQ